MDASESSVANLLRRDRDFRHDLVDRLTQSRQLAHVAVLSGAGLFLELLLIRWLTAEISILLATKNLPLIASFLGLGIGYALAGRRSSTFPLAAPLIALLVVSGAALSGWSGIRRIAPPGSEPAIGVATAAEPAAAAAFYLVIVAAFVLTVLATIPLGQIAGEYMRGLDTIRGYSANVAGSLGGIALFFATAALSWPPWVGAAAVLAACVAYQRTTPGRWLGVACGLLAAGSMAALDHSTGERTVWSPYNKIVIQRLPDLELEDGAVVSPGFNLRVQNHYYQRILDLRPQVAERLGRLSPLLANAARAYSLPYQFKSPGTVLVVGAGTGNDVAAALRAGAERVDAVEIDPEIVALGRELHPEQPYADPRVRVFATDARAFFATTDERYDLVVFGLLDSHTSHFSSLASNIRLDNYVYTVEALRAAYGLVATDGILSLALYVDQPWIATRMERMLRTVLGVAPHIVPIFYDNGFAFLAGKGTVVESRLEPLGRGLSDATAAQFPPGPPATDDWPFLYLRGHSLPSILWWSSAAVLLVAALLVAVLFRGRVRFDRHLFFLGAGFLLVETRTIAQLGLLYGSTWRVSAITIAGILGLILIANTIVARRGPLPSLPLYLALGATLAANTLLPPSAVVGGPLASAAATGFYLLPLVFASLVFASSIARREDLSAALASNLVGGVLGGLLENLCLVVGISALSWIAIVVYGASWSRR